MGNFQNPFKIFWTEINFKLFVLLLEAGKKFKIFLIFKNKKFPASHNRKNFPDEKFIKGSPFIFFEVKKISYCGKQEKNFSQNSKKLDYFGSKFDPKIILILNFNSGESLIFDKFVLSEAVDSCSQNVQNHCFFLFSEAVLGDFAHDFPWSHNV